MVATLAARLGGDKRTIALLLVLTSFGTHLELRRHGGLSQGELVRTLQRWARAELG